MKKVAGFYWIGVLTAALLFSNARAFAWQLQYAPILTPWAQLVDTNNPLSEYPRSADGPD